MVSLEHISIHFGERTLFDDLNAIISPHDRIGLVGANGSGKSTLLKVIANLLPTDKGIVKKAHYVSIGYLPQDDVSTTGKTLFQEVETAFEHIISIQQEIEEAQHTLSTADPSSEDYTDTLDVFGELQHRLEDLDAYRMKSKIERILMGLGFSVKDFERQTEEFSGGWQMRIAMAKLLLQEPNVLLLDEPTNHLDLDSLQWLEEYLKQYNGAVVLVSHDRAFLDNLTKKTFALSNGAFDIYNGNYSFYEKERNVRRELLQNQYKNQQQQIKQTQEFIDRFRYKATKARQVQSRIKQLEKIDLVEIESEESKIHFHFPQPQQSGRVVMELSDIDKSYNTTNVFNNFDLKIERGEKIAVVGVNGSGKSTLARILAGTEPFGAGERLVGYNVTISYFAQDQAEELDNTKDVLTTVEEVSTSETRAELRTLLGSFLFHGDDVFKKVKVLSGGEKSRLALAKMLLRPANFLLMDEPTNHLDMRSKKVLQEALQNYEGTYFIISHDRAFLDPLVNKVLEISPGSARIFLGTVSEYITKKKEEQVVATKENQDVKQRNSDKASPLRKNEQEHKKALAKELRALKKQIVQYELEISCFENRKKEIESQLANPEIYKHGEDAKNISNEYKEVQKKIVSIYREWTLATEQLEKLVL